MEYRFKMRGCYLRSIRTLEVYAKESSGIKSYFTLVEVLDCLKNQKQYRVPDSYDFGLMASEVLLPKGEYWVKSKGSPETEGYDVYFWNGDEWRMEQKKTDMARLLVVED